MMTTTIVAPAKLTTQLRIVGVRDDGYHLLDAEMISIDLCDTLTFREGNAIAMSRGADHVAIVGENIIAKALRVLDAAASVSVEKHIPFGGGLGGGSTNAAAVFRWAKRFDVDLAARVGADVPFCLRGGRAHVQGIGENITPLPFVERAYTLVLPPFGISTASVYASYDALDARASDTHSQNHLLAAATLVEPRLAEWMELLSDWTGATPQLAGSGSTVFVEGSFDLSECVAPRGGKSLVVRALPAYE